MARLRKILSSGRTHLTSTFTAASIAAACLPGNHLVPSEAAPGVSAMLADGAYVTAFKSGPEPRYFIDSGVVVIPAWAVGVERTFLALHETCHAWQNRHRQGAQWIARAGQPAAAIGMDAESAADVCALHYMGLTAIPIPPDRRDPGYLTGAVPAAWLAWAAETFP